MLFRALAEALWARMAEIRSLSSEKWNSLNSRLLAQLSWASMLLSSRQMTRSSTVSTDSTSTRSVSNQWARIQLRVRIYILSFVIKQVIDWSIKIKLARLLAHTGTRRTLFTEVSITRDRTRAILATLSSRQSTVKSSLRSSRQSCNSPARTRSLADRLSCTRRSTIKVWVALQWAPRPATLESKSLAVPLAFDHKSARIFYPHNSF